jgi:hypothetical protein
MKLLTQTALWGSTGVFVAAMVLSVASAQTSSPVAASSLSPQELQTYDKAHAVTEWTAKEIRKRHELKNLQLAENQDGLPKILQQAGERVEAFTQALTKITAIESVNWKVDDPALPHSYSGQFRYVLARSESPTDNFDEFRTAPDGNAINGASYDGSAFLTLGFGRSILFLHPHNQAACRFRYFGNQTLGDQETEVIGFAQVPANGFHLAEFFNGKRAIPLFFQGLAWIDARTHDIVRMQTDLLAPPPGQQLVRETTDVDFAVVHLPAREIGFVLPQKVVVDMWQNPVATRLESMSGEATRSVRHQISEDSNEGPQTTLHCHSVYTYSSYKSE